MGALGRLIAVLATFCLVVAPMPAASAAVVDYVVNLSSDKSIYRADEAAVLTVTVANRGAEDAAVPADLLLSSPWGLPVLAKPAGCVASGGAVCPTVTDVGTEYEHKYAAQLPPLTRAQALTFTFELASWEYGGARELRAGVTPRSGDTEAIAATNVSVVKPEIISVSGDYATQITQPMTPTGTTVTARATYTNRSPYYPTTIWPSLRIQQTVGDRTVDSALVSVRCIAATGSATCADLVAAPGNGLEDPDGDGVFTPTFRNTGYGLQYPRLPISSSIELEYVYERLADLCELNQPSTQTWTTRSEVNGEPRDNNNNSDDSDTETTSAVVARVRQHRSDGAPGNRTRDAATERPQAR